MSPERSVTDLPGMNISFAVPKGTANHADPLDKADPHAVLMPAVASDAGRAEGACEAVCRGRRSFG